MIKQTFIFLALIFVSLFGNSQSVRDLRINEVLVLNDSNYVDDYGMHSPWIEIFNSSYNSVSMGGCYLSNDINNPTMYKIPKGDPRTVVGTRNYIVFWADNKTTRGILHLNFDLRDSKAVYLFSGDGKTLIDKIDIGFQKPDVSFGRLPDGGKLCYLPKSTPKSNNNTADIVTAATKFKEIDPTGAGMAIIAMTVVFLALILLYLIFKQIGLYYKRTEESKQLIKEGKIEEAAKMPEVQSGDVYAAIALALHLHNNELHDNENTIITIQKASKNYSPWSSKIYGLRQTPNILRNNKK